MHLLGAFGSRAVRVHDGRAAVGQQVAERVLRPKFGSPKHHPRLYPMEKYEVFIVS